MQHPDLEQLKAELAKTSAARAEILGLIDVIHAAMTAHVHKAVAKFEREFWENDDRVFNAMARLNQLRAENTPLRTKVWDLQAKIKELEERDLCPLTCREFKSGGPL